MLGTYILQFGRATHSCTGTTTLGYLDVKKKKKIFKNTQFKIKEKDREARNYPWTRLIKT